ncbi:MAG: hypothetical protein AB1512_27205 [Thermodesulfobacteriota bacterium]
MKVIISHDVDHLTVWEHRRDMIVPKFVVRSLIELGLGFISGREMRLRFQSIAANRWNRIEELMGFDRQHGIPATFFVGMSNGKGLSYGRALAGDWIRRILGQGFSVGVHGVAYDDYSAMAEEHDGFKRASGLPAFGVRMHYLRMAPGTHDLLGRIGYAFDSTEPAMKGPYKIGGMWEFPLHVMDGRILSGGGRWQDRHLAAAQSETKSIIELASDAGLGYFTLLFHDRYFCESFKTWKEWYIWFVEYCEENGLEFISYTGAIEEMVSRNGENEDLVSFGL